MKRIRLIDEFEEITRNDELFIESTFSRLSLNISRMSVVSNTVQGSPLPAVNVSILDVFTDDAGEAVIVAAFDESAILFTEDL